MNRDSEIQILDDIDLDGIVGGARKKAAKKKTAKKKHGGKKKAHANQVLVDKPGNGGPDQIYVSPNSSLYEPPA